MTDSRGISPHSTCRIRGRSLTSYTIWLYYSTWRSICKERIFPSGKPLEQTDLRLLLLLLKRVQVGEYPVSVMYDPMFLAEAVKQLH